MDKKHISIIILIAIIFFLFIKVGFTNTIKNGTDNTQNTASVNVNDSGQSNINKKDIENKNNLIEGNNISIKDKLGAKKVAENFIKAITIFDFKNPNGMAENAIKYVCNDKKNEVKSLYIHLGKGEEVKKTVLDNIESEEVKNEEDNDYILFRVHIKWNAIDKNNQKINGGDETYMTKLLKENGEYKVFEYWVD